MPAAAVDDLRARLRATRWPEAETVADWSQGIPLDYVREVCAYWAESYDMDRVAARLGAAGSFRAVVEGLGIHFLHVPSPVSGALPLVLTHGWPGSVVEFLGVLGPLSDPVAHGGDAADAFHVVVPTLPGYGFSDKPAAPGWGVERIAGAWAALMTELGYERFAAQGGDWGAGVTVALSRAVPERLAGIHLNMASASPALLEGLGELTAAEEEAIAAYQHYRRWDSGYAKQQSTRPQTLGYGLVDSPAAQAAWILEKFWAWTDAGGHPENVISRDELLDNVMLYWLPAAGASSARLYWESFRGFDLDPVDAPTGISMFPREIFRLSRRWAERRFSDLRHWGEPPRGGHFAAFEQPELFVDEVRAAFRTMR